MRPVQIPMVAFTVFELIWFDLEATQEKAPKLLLTKKHYVKFF